MAEIRPIDANALKEALQKVCYSIDFCREHNIDYSVNLNVALMAIDNALTVEYPFYQEAYQTGYEEGKNERPQGEITNEDIQNAIKIGYNDGFEMAKAKYERPQGEWIKIFENPFTNGYVCPFCNHKIQVTEQFLPQVTECESCGAQMVGGEK